MTYKVQKSSVMALRVLLARGAMEWQGRDVKTFSSDATSSTLGYAPGDTLWKAADALSWDMMVLLTPDSLQAAVEHLMQAP